MNEKLNKIFDLEPVTSEVTSVAPIKEEVVENTDIESTGQIDIAQQTQLELIEMGKDSLESLIEFAKSSESPRAWEVVSNLIKTTSDVANSLATVALEKGKIKSKTADPGGTNITNNTQAVIFNGTTSELQKFLKEQNDKV